MKYQYDIPAIAGLFFVICGIGAPVDSNAGLIVPSDDRWPMGVIPYEVDSSMSGIAASKLDTAIQEFHTETPIRFVLRNAANASGYPDYIRVLLDPDAISSRAGSIGFSAGETVVELAPNVENPPTSSGLDYGVRTIIHELGHVVGLYHENSRLDMWDYFTIDWSLVADPDCPDRRETNLIGIPTGGYDYFSVMSALPPFCGVNELGGPSLNYLDPVAPNVSWQDLRSNIDDTLSEGDIAAIETLYQLAYERVDFDAPAPSPGRLYQWQGIDFMAQWLVRGAYGPDPSNSIWSDATSPVFALNGDVRYFTVYTDSECILSISDGVNPVYSQTIVAGELQDVAPGWSQSSAIVQFNGCGTDLGISEISYYGTSSGSGSGSSSSSSSSDAGSSSSADETGASSSGDSSSSPNSASSSGGSRSSIRSRNGGGSLCFPFLFFSAVLLRLRRNTSS